MLSGSTNRMLGHPRLSRGARPRERDRFAGRPSHLKRAAITASQRHTTRHAHCCRSLEPFTCVGSHEAFRGSEHDPSPCYPWSRGQTFQGRNKGEQVRWGGCLQLVMSGDFRAVMSLFLYIVNAAVTITTHRHPGHLTPQSRSCEHSVGLVINISMWL